MSLRAKGQRPGCVPAYVRGQRTGGHGAHGNAGAAASGGRDRPERGAGGDRTLTGRGTEQFVLGSLSLAPGEAEAFRIQGVPGRVEIAGSSSVGLMSGFNRWLTCVAGGHLSTNGDRLARSGAGPSGSGSSTTSPPAGRTRALALIGQEVVWSDTFQDFGLSELEVRQWIAQPAHQPWQWYGEITGFDWDASAYRGPVSVDLLNRQRDLGRRIIDRMRELGITPVFPAFVGHVPDQMLADAHPGTHITAQADGWILGYARRPASTRVTAAPARAA